MHIAQFIHRYPPALGGAEAYTKRLCDYLAAHGDDVRVWTTTAVELGDMWSSANPERERGGEVDPLAHAQGSPRITRYSPLTFPARRYILKALSLPPVRRWQCLTTPCNPICPQMWRDSGSYMGPVDAVHAAAFPYSFPIVCGLRLARRCGVPFFLTPFLHIGDISDPNDPTRRQYTKPHLRWLLKQADGIFVQTHAESDMVVSLGVERARVHLQGLGVDPAECTGGNRSRMRQRCRITAEEVVVGHLANNSEEKGTCDLLRAAERLWNAGYRFHVMLAGPEMPNFRRFWDSFSHKQNVTRLGVLSEQGKRAFFAGIDAFALPSRTDSFGLVLLEAWANAKPNLVYRAGGPGELVRHDRDGLQAKCGDVNELAIALGRLVGDANLRWRLGESGASRIPQVFRWERSLSLFREVVTGERTPVPTMRPKREAVSR